jgi:hypothetical protein
LFTERFDNWHCFASKEACPIVVDVEAQSLEPQPSISFASSGEYEKVQYTPVISF